MGVVVTYSQPLDTSAFSNWERIKSPGNRDILYPKEFASTNVVIGDNTDNGARFRVIDNNGVDRTAEFVIISNTISAQLTDTVNNIFSNLQMLPNTVALIVTSGNIGKTKRVEITDLSVQTIADDVGNGKRINITQDENTYLIIAEDTSISNISNLLVEPNRIILDVSTISGNANINQDQTGFNFISQDNALNTIEVENKVASGFKIKVNSTFIFGIEPSGLIKSNRPVYDDDAAAGAGGLIAGEEYQTSGAGAAPLNVPGIVMVKQ